MLAESAATITGVSSARGYRRPVHAVPLASWHRWGTRCCWSRYHVSAKSHSPAAARHTVPLGCTASGRTVRPACGAVLGDVAATGYGGAADYAGGGKAVCRARGAGAGAWSRPRLHAPATARHTVPALPAGCWQRALLTRLQVLVVHGLPSSVHAVPLVFLASDGQARLAVRCTSRPGRTRPRLRGTPCRWARRHRRDSSCSSRRRSRPDRTGRPTRAAYEGVGLHAVRRTGGAWSPCRFPATSQAPVAGATTPSPHCPGAACWPLDCCYHARCRRARAAIVGTRRAVRLERADWPRSRSRRCRSLHRRRTAPSHRSRRCHTSRR